MSQQNNSFKQTSISQFFTPCKGPLKFQSTTMKTSIKEVVKTKKKRRSKKLQNKKNVDEDDDVIIIEDIKEIKEEVIEITEEARLSPKIFFEDELITSTQTSNDERNRLNDSLESPSKKAKIKIEQDENCSNNNNFDINLVKNEINFKQPNFSCSSFTTNYTQNNSQNYTQNNCQNYTQNNSQNYTQNNSQNNSQNNFQSNSSNIKNIAVTKSQFEIKYETKPSKTQLMHTTLDSMINISLDSSHRTYKFNLETVIYQMEDVDFELKTDVENEEDRKAIKYVLDKIMVIIKNFLRPNFENLLFENEKTLILSFCSMKSLYQFICCKLFTHQIKWYQPESFIQKLRNCNLNLNSLQIDKMMKDLERYDFIQTDYKKEELSELLNLLKVTDIKNIYKSLRIKTKARRKDQYIKAILDNIPKQTTLDPSKPMDEVVKNMIYKKLGNMFKITESFYKTFYKLHLMYSFTNPQLPIPEGVYKFMIEIFNNNIIPPTYKISEDVIFESPEEFAAFYKAYSYKEELLQEADKKNSDKFTMLRLCEEIFKEFKLISNQNSDENTKPGFLNRFTPGSKYVSALTFGIDKLSASYPSIVISWIEELLKQKQFNVRKRSLLYAQLATIYKKNKDDQKACEILAKGLKDKSLLMSDLCELIYRAKSYMKRKGNRGYFEDVLYLFEKAPDVQLFSTILIKGVSDTAEPLYKYISRSGEIQYLSVENYAIRHYIDNTEFEHGVHCEGTIINMLYHIFFWDIIYRDDIPKTFINPIQLEPLDFYHQDFYASRKHLIDERIEKIKSDWSREELNDYIRNTWVTVSNFKNIAIPLEVTLELTIHFVSVIRRDSVAKIMERFVKGYDEWHAGLPDLFLWNDVNCKFVEVKGPGDKLSTKQILWLDFLNFIGLDIEVCHVKSIMLNGLGGRQ